MMIDDTQTPSGEETPKPEQEAGQASDTAQAHHAPSDEMPAAAEPAATLEPEATQTPEPEPPAPADPQPDTPATPVEPAVPTPADPTPAPEPPQPTPPAVPHAEEPKAEEPKAEQSREDDAALFESYMNAMESGVDDADSSFKKLSKGDRIEATIIQVDRDKVFVDLGTKAEGVVPLHELTDDNIESAHDHYKVGDKINVIVLRPEGGAEGNALVSKKRADFEEAWDRIEDAYRTQEMITAQVVDRVKGGLVVDVGVRGFVPATHVGSGKLRNIEKYVGQPLQLKVIEIDRDRKKVVLSNRQAEEERRANAKEEIFTKVHPGDVIEGTVRRLTDYGAFVDLGGVDGLLHISEMSWMRINHPKEMFREGQKIKVMVLRLDPGAGKISLGHRQVLPDPWNLIKQNYKVGQTLTVPIGRLVQSGAFIKLPEGAEAFMPVSEMSVRRIKRPEDVVSEGQEVEVQIIDLRTDERRMVLSMRALGGGASYSGSREGGSGAPPSYDDDMRGDKRGKPGGKKGGKKGGRGGRDYDDDFEDVAGGRRGFATGGATIGERLGMLKGFLGRDDEDEESEAKGEAEGEAEEAES
ncbi:MAG TPA: 30S ribosomal protein S1 [Fimbriimonadaceae bacterium]|nr:30S ribosomal protein S1 [Fimbriimonadaceae bacterium]